MGFLKNILGGILNEGKTALVNEVKNAVSDNGAKSTVSMPQAVPDKPVPFAFKNSWLCIKSNSPEAVISELRLIDAVPTNWSSGMDGVDDGKFFVSPAINGWVAVVGFPTFGWSDDTELEQGALKDIAKRFSEVQAFASHRVVDLCAWAKFRDGKTVRAYYWLGESGEVLINEGECTPEEHQLGLDNFVGSADDNWDEKELPDEMSVCEIAAAWGIDPMFSEGEYEKGTGYLCGGTDY